MNSVFSRIFMGMLFTSLLILTIISLIITFAIQTSISTWNQGKQEDFQTLLIPIISKIHRLNGGLTEGNIEEALEPYLTDSLFVYVFNSKKNPIYLFNQGRRISLEEFEEDKNTLNAGISKLSLVPISDGNDVIAYLASDAIDFLADQANRDFIGTMIKAVSIGISITLILTLLISGFISSSFSRQTGLLVDGISSLSNGNRHVSFPELGIRELDEISRSSLNLQNQLTKEEQLRQQWMQDISHDLKTPMTAVISQFEAMVDGALDIGQSRLVSLLSEIRRIEALILNLQELSRYESPEMTIKHKTITTTDFLEDIHDRFSFLSEQKNITLTCLDSQNEFVADEHLLQRCISNIIQNALQHTASGGRINVEITAYPSQTCFRILNTGHIPEKDLGSIFDRLYRGSQARSGGGSGLGLSIAKAIIDLHRGSIKARNIEDSVEFTVWIPGSGKEA